MPEKRIYRISFMNQGKLYEIYAHSVGSSSMLGFVEVAELTFGEKSAVVLDPSEESLKHEFRDVRCCYIPVHSIIRIDEVSKQGHAKITDMPEGGMDKITPFPMPVPGKDSSS
ncbi:MAG: DUF1820 family protein [Mariprofundaceae bacterium]|nr:DUF1820 family protein [Mariprofundaceae bacterium]